MKKRILYILFTIFISFFYMSTVSADNCSKIQEKIDTYNSLQLQLSGLDCTQTNNQTIVATCNNSNVRKNIIVTELMKLQENNEICESQETEVNSIIEENSDKCGKIFDDSFSDFVNGFMIFFYIVAPILLIFFGSLDFTKAMVSSDQESLKKAWKNFSKRLAATILLFLAPTVVNIIISFNVTDKYLSGNAYSCDYEYLTYGKEYNIRYVPSNNSSTTLNTISGDLLTAADLVHQRMENERWTYNLSSKLYWRDIERSTNNPKKGTCCATFVASSLYKAGIFSEEEMNSYNYNSSTSTYNFLKSKGWIEISNYSQLQPGDIVFMTSRSGKARNKNNIGHVQIFAGRNSNGSPLWYNAGSTSAITRANPYVQTDSYVQSRFITAMRR